MMQRFATVVSVLLLAWPAAGQFDSGSDGTDGALDCAALFAMNPDGSDIASGVTRGGDGHAVLRMVGLVEAQPGNDFDGMEAQRNSLQTGIARDLLEQYRGYLEGRFPVTVNRGALDAMF